MATMESKSFSFFAPFCRTSILVCAMLAAAPAFPAPLDKDACTNLSQEMQNLKALDVDKLMEKGPEWAISNLSQTDLNLVRRYIDVDEQIKFRCLPPSSLVHLRAPEGDEDEDSSEKPATESAAKPGAKPKAGLKQAETGASSPAKPKQVKASKKAVKPRQAQNAAGPASTGSR